METNIGDNFLDDSIFLAIVVHIVQNGSSHSIFASRINWAMLHVTCSVRVIITQNLLHQLNITCFSLGGGGGERGELKPDLRVVTLFLLKQHIEQNIYMHKYTVFKAVVY